MPAAWSEGRLGWFQLGEACGSPIEVPLKIGLSRLRLLVVHVLRSKATRMTRQAAERWPPAVTLEDGGYLPIEARAASIFDFTASRLKLAPFCIGGNSIAVIASFSTCCWTNTNRQNSYLNHWKYSCDPDFVPLSGQPVRSNGSRRRLVKYGTSALVLSPSQPA